MIIEFIINMLVAIIKFPIALFNIPTMNFTQQLRLLYPYTSAAYSFVRFFFDDIALTIIGLSLTCIALFKMVDLISTIVGFFKKTGGSD